MTPLTHALFLSDLHLGWIPVLASHERLLTHLPAAIDDAPLVVLNGDIIDSYRTTDDSRARDLIARFVDYFLGLRAEGREVLYIEGNHDTPEKTAGPLFADCWFADFVGSTGEKIRVLHGHRFTATPKPVGAYERIGSRLLTRENRLYARSALARRLYRFSSGWVVGAIGLSEDISWRPGLIEQVRRWDFDRIVHGHYHFGPGEIRLPEMTLHRTGAWVSRGHLGSVDRVLRYQHGRFERLALAGGRWVVTDDGR